MCIIESYASYTVSYHIPVLQCLLCKRYAMISLLWCLQKPLFTPYNTVNSSSHNFYLTLPFFSLLTTFLAFFLLFFFSFWSCFRFFSSVCVFFEFTPSTIISYQILSVVWEGTIPAREEMIVARIVPKVSCALHLAGFFRNILVLQEDVWFNQNSFACLHTNGRNEKPNVFETKMFSFCLFALGSMKDLNYQVPGPSVSALTFALAQMKLLHHRRRLSFS